MWQSKTFARLSLSLSGLHEWGPPSDDMADPTELAKKARATLASSLEALQREGVPDALLEIAEPIAKTMGILHRVEKGTGSKAEVKSALDIIRTTLDSLQVLDVDHPAIDDAMEGVAGSLSKLFALARAMPAKSLPGTEPATVPRPMTGPPRASSKPPPKSRPTPLKRSEPVMPATTQVIAAAPIRDIGSPAFAAPTPQPVAPPQPAAFPQPAAAAPVPANPAPAYPAPAYPAPANPAPANPGYQTIPIAQPQPPEVGETLPVALEVPAELRQQMAQQAATQAAVPQPQPAAPTPRERVPGMTDAPVPIQGAKHVEVELGAHSPSNFYKGLSGNDVIDHGGIFVATYTPPKIGEAVALRILLPGDLEFEGDAIVQWTREVRSSDSDPGFGAKFTRISGDGRQLVYRYVRNREPMFYDDM
jgi:hypothetical protein